MTPQLLRFEAPGLNSWLPTRIFRPQNVLHGLLIEGRRGLGLVQVGLGSLDFIAPWQRLGLAAPQLHPEAAPPPLRQQLLTAGYRADDVKDIFLSHLHPCLTGGLHDFPQARVHGLPEALGTAQNRIARLLPDPTQWVSPLGPLKPHHGLASYPVMFEDQELRLLALPGPSPGHAGWLLPHGDGWLLHLGALIESPDELSDAAPSPRQAARVFTDHKPFSRLESLQQVRRILKREGSSLTALASFVAPALLGAHLPLLGATEASDG